MEFHAWAEGFYTSDLLRELPALRADYRAAGGRLITFTTLREPRAHIVARYQMWPPKACNATSCMQEPFSAFLSDAVGLQTRVLAGEPTKREYPLPVKRQQTRHPRGNFSCGEEHFARALAVLSSFDFIGDLANLSATAHLVETCAGLQPRRRVPHISEGHSAIVTMDERTRPSVQAAIEAAAVCDDRLRRFALRFVGSNDCGTAAGTWASKR